MTSPIHRVVLVRVVLLVPSRLVVLERVRSPIDHRQLGDKVELIRWVCRLTHRNAVRPAFRFDALMGEEQGKFAGGELRLRVHHGPDQAATVVLVRGDGAWFPTGQASVGDAELES